MRRSRPPNRRKLRHKTPPRAGRLRRLPPRPAPSAAAANSQHRIDAILAELDGPLKAVSKAAPAEPVDEPDRRRTYEAEAPEPAPSSFRTIDPASDVVFAERPADPPPEPYAGL